jgi:hypothetical protein
MAEHSGERTVAEQRQGGRLPEREWREGGAFVPAQHGDRKTPSSKNNFQRQGGSQREEGEKVLHVLQE